MNKTIINVPRGINFLSEWEGFTLPDHPCILNKQITGCGFTEYCLTNNLPVILCSPRKVLLKNKLEQHSNDVYYAINKFYKSLNIDGNSTKSKKEINLELTKDQLIEFKDGVKNAYFKFIMERKPPKILVTYDSFRLVLEALEEINIFDKFYIVVDEFQSIFTDSRFKATTELEFVNYLQKSSKVCFVSATPMMEEYLDLMTEFKNLPYYELDWGKLEPGRIEIPTIIPISYKGSLVSVASSIIEDYQRGIFEKDIYVNDQGDIFEIESKEVVIFVNSVKNICSIIKKCGLTIDNTNVLCADNEDNKNKVRLAFGLKKSQLPEDFLMQVPKENERHKMFTLCTKTVYLGADFYSTCARTIVLSDANIECLAVDITLDLSQILGRQRLSCNPWKNYAEVYFKSGMGVHDITEEEFNNVIKKKESSTKILLDMYESADLNGKEELVKRLEDLVYLNHYKDDYISIDKHSGSFKIPKKNDLVRIAEQRAFDIQKKDYYNRFTVLSKIKELSKECIDTNIINDFLNTFNSLSQFTDKMRILCITLKSIDPILKDRLLHLVPKEFKNYCSVLDLSTIGTLGYQRGKLEREYQNRKLGINPFIDNSLLIEIFKTFSIGSKYSKVDIKSKLQLIFDSLDISKVAKASDLERWFELKLCKINNPLTKKRDMGFEILKKK